MLLYLDLNCFNRPFDDQRQERIAHETTAIYSVLRRVVEGLDQMAWSAVLDFENSQHPLVDRRDEIARWGRRAVTHVQITQPVSDRARQLTEAGFGPLDAVHLACAEAAGCSSFLTCDDRLLRKAQRVDLALRVQNPVDYLEEQTDA